MESQEEGHGSLRVVSGRERQRGGPATADGVDHEPGYCKPLRELRLRRLPSRSMMNHRSAPRPEKYRKAAAAAMRATSAAATPVRMARFLVLNIFPFRATASRSPRTGAMLKDDYKVR